MLFKVSDRLPEKSPALTVDKRAASAPTVAVRLSLPVILIVVSDVSAEISLIVLASVVVNASLPTTLTTLDRIFSVSIAVKVISAISFCAAVFASTP